MSFMRDGRHELYIICKECGNYYPIDDRDLPQVLTPYRQLEVHSLLGCTECDSFEAELIGDVELAERLANS